jgi:hypothetical protein
LSSILALLTSLCRIEIFSPRDYITRLRILCTFSWFSSCCMNIVPVECCCLPYDLFPWSNFIIVSKCAAFSVFQPSILFLLLLLNCESPWYSLQIFLVFSKILVLIGWCPLIYDFYGAAIRRFRRLNLQMAAKSLQISVSQAQYNVQKKVITFY